MFDRFYAAICIVLALAVTLHAFEMSPISSVRTFDGLCNAYVPDGFTPEQYKKLKEKERNKNKGKNLGAVSDHKISLICHLIHFFEKILGSS